MALFEITKTKEVEINPPAPFKLLNALPHPVLVRDKNLQCIFQNKAALRKKLSIRESYYYPKEFQKEIHLQSARLFQKENKQNTQHFELEINDRYFKIHQTLEQTPDGDHIIIETFNEITSEKINALTLQVLSLNSSNEEEVCGNYLNQLTAKIAEAFHLDAVLISITDPGKKENTTLSSFINKKHTPNETYPLKDNPCAQVYATKNTVYIPEQAKTLFPYSAFLKNHNLNAIYGCPLINPENEIVGNIFIGNNKAIPRLPLLKTVLKEITPKITLEVECKRNVIYWIQKLKWELMFFIY